MLRALANGIRFALLFFLNVSPQCVHRGDLVHGKDTTRFHGGPLANAQSISEWYSFRAVVLSEHITPAYTSWQFGARKRHTVLWGTTCFTVVLLVVRQDDEIVIGLHFRFFLKINPSLGRVYSSSRGKP